MKRTKSMSYEETRGSFELYLYIVNTGHIYNSVTKPVIRALQRKAAKGIYCSEQAVDAYYQAVCVGAKEYEKEFSDREDWGQTKFSVQERFTAAADLEKHYREEVFEGADEEKAAGGDRTDREDRDEFGNWDGNATPAYLRYKGSL